MAQAMQPVPNLNIKQSVSKKSVATNDEVAFMLKELKLDRSFFEGHMNKEQINVLMPPKPDEGFGGKKESVKSQEDIMAIQRQVVRKRTELLLQRTKSQGAQATDFDLYLGEALMPALAQSLDALCKQHDRMQKQGDSLDPKVRARFNPITFIAQQLLRRHPKHARTPRRQGIYANFKGWSDYERGRREMLRRKDVVADVFHRCMLKSNKGYHSLTTIVEVVLPDIDATLGLEGILECEKMLDHSSWVSDGLSSPTRRKGSLTSKEDFLTSEGYNFEQFWYRFAQILLKNDIVPYSALLRGAQLKRQKEQLEKEAAEAREKEKRERQEMEALQQRQLKDYTSLHSELVESEEIQGILNGGKILTGDDVRPGDVGFEHEVPPKGKHVTLLFRLMVLLGFEKLEESRKEQIQEEGVEMLWDDELASNWVILQRMHNAEICDGVVEAEVLAQVVVPAVGYILLRNKILDDLESRDDDAGLDPGRARRNTLDLEGLAVQSLAKPSKQELCQLLDITPARLQWLHRLFQSYVEEGTPGVICKYPEDPAAINKAQMKELISEVRPEMDDDEFEMRFRRIDQDSSGKIEFDEFVIWVREDEIRVNAEDALRKMPFNELAQVFGQSDELIAYLHDRFQDRLPEGEQDDYPEDAKTLPLDEIQALVKSFVPSVSEAQFANRLSNTVFSTKDALAFDEFLEVLPFEELPEEISGPMGGELNTIQEDA